MTEHQLDEAASERDRLLLLCQLSEMSERDALDFLHRVHMLLGREKQNAIVRARFQALIDGPREFSNDNQVVQLFGFDAVQGTTAADRSPHCVRPVPHRHRGLSTPRCEIIDRTAACLARACHAPGRPPPMSQHFHVVGHLDDRVDVAPAPTLAKPRLSLTLGWETGLR